MEGILAATDHDQGQVQTDDGQTESAIHYHLSCVTLWVNNFS